ncbi:MAG: amino acid adenylation domain-containing protein [Chroococcales cyanobacterium]
MIEGYRLSPQQKHLWLLHSNNQNFPYVTQTQVLLKGELDLERLKVAIATIVNRYEILRTTFHCLPGVSIPVQAIADSVIPSIQILDYTGLSRDIVEDKIQHLVSQPLDSLDSAKGTLLEIAIVILSPQEHLLILRLPSLCADRDSIQIIVKEIFQSYEETEEDLEEEILQYADLAEWQNQLLEDEETQAGREYWQENVKYDPPKFQALTPSPSPTGRGEHKRRASLQFPPFLRGARGDLSQQFISVNLRKNIHKNLEAIATESQTSLSSVLLTAWQAFLGKFIQSENLVIGTELNGRKYEELELAIGLIAKVLPIESNFNENIAFSDLLAQTVDSVNKAATWQEYFSWENVASFKEYKTILPFSFALNEIQMPLKAAGLTGEIQQLVSYCDRFSLQLCCIQRKNQLTLEFHYDTNCYFKAEIDHLAQQFQVFLNSLASQPEVKIGELDILTESDRQHLLIDLNNTFVDYPINSCLHSQFEAQVKKTPNAIAVVSDPAVETRHGASPHIASLQYAELNEKANQLAHYLKQQGIKTGSIVGICHERSIELIISILGILKAGAAYLPLDPALPKNALAFRLKDSETSILITHSSLLSQLPKTPATVICLDQEQAKIASYPTSNPKTNVTPNDLVYLLYTSGSTGQPKGVAVEHSQLLNYVNSIQEKLNLKPSFSYGLISTISADLGNTMLFPALVSGGCLHIISQQRAINPIALAEYCTQFPLDCLKIVPSHLKALLASNQKASFLPHQRLILGGEALDWAFVKQLQQYLPKTCQLFNHYGPTETTVGVLTHQVLSQEEFSTKETSRTVPLGRPLANTQIYILNQFNQPVPFGVAGEICIGGSQVARGYWKREELTAQRFISNPFNPQTRLYKTGDLGRYLPDGTIEFLGRIDSQVKLNGYRVELGEIEAIIKQQSAVKDAVVIVSENEAKPQLVGYLVIQPGESLDSERLRQQLRSHLPDYMIPSVFVSLKAFPLTPNGKVDRHALPAPPLQTVTERQITAPRNEIEQVLSQIWSEVLNQKQVGIYDNFFALGGDSIQSIRLIAKASQFGLKLTPKQIFENPTIAQLATIVETKSTSTATQELVTGVVPLTPIQQWFFEQNFANAHHWNQSVLLTVSQSLDLNLLGQSLQAILRHHDALRLQFIQKGLGWEQVHADLPLTTSVQYFDLSNVAVADQEKRLQEIANQVQSSLNLSDASLMAIALFHLGNNQPDVLLWTIHHLIVDGVSWRILLEDLQTVYQQLFQNKTVQLPPKTTPWKQWAQQLELYAKSPKLQSEKDYWLSRQSVSPLPTDFKGENTIALTRHVSLALTAEETQALLSEVPAAYQTQINDILLTALAQTFAEWIGSNSVLLDLEGHGREDLFEDVDISQTVGWFTTLFPVQLTLEDPDSLEESIKAIKEQLRQIPHHGIGYGILRYLAQDKEICALSQAQVRFNYLGQFDTEITSSSLFQLASQSGGQDRSLDSHRPYLLDINSCIRHECLEMDWSYSQGIYSEATITALADNFMEKLRSLINHCCTLESGGYTPSDFPQMQLSQAELDDLLSDLD